MPSRPALPDRTSLASKTSPSPTPVAAIDVDLLFLINQAGFALNAEMSTALGDIGISPREFCVLSHALKGDSTQIELAEMSALDKTTMVVTLDRLAEAGLAERRLSSTDRRARIVSVTTAGRQAVDRAQSVVAAMYANLLGALPRQDREVFLRSLIALVAGPLAQPSHVERPARRRQAG